MRGTALLTLPLVVSTGACVSDDLAVRTFPPPEITYRRPQPSSAREHAPAPKRTSTWRYHRAPAHNQAWMPDCGRINPRWTTIVVHHSATANGGAKVFDRYHRKRGWDELGYHFVIGNGSYSPDGHVEVGSRWHKQKHGAHCKTPSNYYNEHGIGICLVGNFNEATPTPNQLATLERLVRFLCSACRIPSNRVTTHHYINSKTECPGRHFSLAALRQSLNTPITATSMP